MSQRAAPVLIAGGGPTGTACAVELGQRDIAAVCHDKGSILDSIYHFPEEMRWYSTRDLLDIGGVPFAVPQAHPTRLDALAYYRGIAEKFQVKVIPESRVVRIRPREEGGLFVSLEGRLGPSEYTVPAAILATGFFHNPKKLNVPGEDLPHVHSRFVSSYPFHDRNVVVIGGKNSAAEAALDLYRHGAGHASGARRRDLRAREVLDQAGSGEPDPRRGDPRAPRCHHPRNHAGVRAGAPPKEKKRSPADVVFPLICYEPDFALFERCGVRLEGPQKVSAHDPETLESNVPNLYLAGAILGGTEIGHIFIENSRHHAGMIASAIERRLRCVTA